MFLYNSALNNTWVWWFVIIHFIDASSFTDNSVCDTSSDSPTGKTESNGEMFLKSPKRAQLPKKIVYCFCSDLMFSEYSLLCFAINCPPNFLAGFLFLICLKKNLYDILCLFQVVPQTLFQSAFISIYIEAASFYIIPFSSFQCSLRYLKAVFLVQIPSINLILNHVNWLLWVLRRVCWYIWSPCGRSPAIFWAFDILSINSLHVNCKHLLF